MFSTGLESRFGDSAAFVCLNVLPYETGTVALFSFLSDDEGPAEAAFGHIWAASGHYQRYLSSVDTQNRQLIDTSKPAIN
jgi:hypothetical protein